MKRIFLLACIASLSGLFSSCVTADVLARAEGKPPPRGPQSAPASAPSPAYYALVPLVLPIDIVFWPIEYFYLSDNQTKADQD
jgi:hypothetical protein